MITFEKFDEEYLNLSWNWLNDSEIKKLTMTPDMSKDSQLKWFNNIDKMNNYLIYGIAFDGKKIGAVGLKNIEDNISAEYWGYIGDKNYWGRKLGPIIIMEMTKIALDIGIYRLYLKVGKDNERAKRLYESQGFLRHQITEDGVILMEKHIR